MPRNLRLGAALMLALLAAAPARAQGTAATIPEDIEKRLDGVYMFVTDGSGSYEVYQRLDSQKGLAEADQVVCLLHLCYVCIAQIESARLAERAQAGADMEAIRRRFRAARDAYLGLLRSEPASLAAVATWREANGQILACLRSGDQC